MSRPYYQFCTLLFHLDTNHCSFARHSRNKFQQCGDPYDQLVCSSALQENQFYFLKYAKEWHQCHSQGIFKHVFLSRALIHPWRTVPKNYLKNEYNIYYNSYKLILSRNGYYLAQSTTYIFFIVIFYHGVYIFFNNFEVCPAFNAMLVPGRNIITVELPWLPFNDIRPVSSKSSKLSQGKGQTLIEQWGAFPLSPQQSSFCFLVELYHTGGFPIFT